jgi:hypothetical protein
MLDAHRTEQYWVMVEASLWHALPSAAATVFLCRKSTFGVSREEMTSLVPDDGVRCAKCDRALTSAVSRPHDSI